MEMCVILVVIRKNDIMVIINLYVLYWLENSLLWLYMFWKCDKNVIVFINSFFISIILISVKYVLYKNY